MGSSTDPTNVRMSSTAVIINDSNVNSGRIIKERSLLNNPNLWHKIIVLCSEILPRDVVLKTIMDCVYPLDFIPVNYSNDGLSSSFFARNCQMAIEKLCSQNLVLANPYNLDKPIKLTIILAYSNTTDLVINVQDNISKVLFKRYQSSSKMLNLDNFCKDPDLKEYCTLSQPKILYFVLHLSKHYLIHSLKLSNNDIHIFNPMESLLAMKQLTTLDLRNNLIDKMSKLSILKDMQIKELFLDGNPVCDEYDEYSYISAVRNICPKIEKLDGVILGQKGFLPFRRNYLIKAQGQELIDQFLEHYFTLYDNKDRSALDLLYARDALFSITCQYLAGQTSSSSASLAVYARNSRNLKTLSDFSRCNENLMRGNMNILKTLKALPLTEHDPYSFTVDLVFYSPKTSIVTVTGVFREPASSLLSAEKMCGFTRTFVLRSVKRHQYIITNDQLHISNATSAQQQRAFKVVRVPRNYQVKIAIPSTHKEKEDMISAFKLITKLNIEWSKRCLEECKYDLSKALSLFVDLHKVDKIPDNAFI